MQLVIYKRAKEKNAVNQGAFILITPPVASLAEQSPRRITKPRHILFAFCGDIW